MAPHCFRENVSSFFFLKCLFEFSLTGGDIPELCRVLNRPKASSK